MTPCTHSSSCDRTCYDGADVGCTRCLADAWSEFYRLRQDFDALIDALGYEEANRIMMARIEGRQGKA